MISIWDIAKNIEREGIEYYKKLANETVVGELQGVFLFLSDQEKSHLEMFEQLQTRDRVEPKERQNALHVAQEAFASIVPDFSIRTSLLDANHAYKQALAMETKAIEYYSSLLTELKNPHEREAVAVILEEEQKHESIMESIIDFIQRTDDWLEEDNGFHT